LKKVLVTGGTGFIGSHLVERLCKDKFMVHCLVRQSSDLRLLDGLEVKIIYGDVTDIDSLIPAVTGMDTVFHIAGRSRGYSDKDFYESNVVGTLNLLKAIIQSGTQLERFIFISSQAAAGPCVDDKPITEADDCEPISPYGSSKLAAEEAIRIFHPKIPITVIRSPVVYGPRDNDLFTLYRWVKKGLIPAMGWREHYISFIYVDDLIEGLLLAATHEIAVGKTYYLISDRQVSYRDVGLIIAKTMEKKSVIIHIPVGLSYVTAFVLESIAKLFRKSINLTHYKVRELNAHFWLADDSKAREELDYHPKVFIEEGIQRCVAWYRKEGWL
jgi:nucleoside-diphosphate-sugar epimerase